MMLAMTGEKFDNVGLMLAQMQQLVEQAEVAVQSERTQAASLRQQYQSLQQKGHDLQHSLASIKAQAGQLSAPTDLAVTEVPDSSVTEEQQ